MLRAALIAALVVVTPASADLWTPPPPLGSPSPPTPDTPASPNPDRRGLEGGPRDGRPERAFTLTVVVDPACAETPAVVQDALAFARTHADVAVRILLATRPARSHEGMRPLVVAAETGVTVTRAPGAVRRLAPPALPAVYLEDRRGHAARATGRPPLETLWRVVSRGAGS